MADQLQLRGGTTTEHSTFTGALREVTVDTDKDTLIVHDAATAGGHPLLREDGSNSALSLGTAGTPSIKFTGDTNTGLYSPGADQVAISTNGSARLYIDSSGRVGLGVTSFTAYARADNLVIDGTGHRGITIGSGTSSQSFIAFAPNGATGADTYKGYINYDNSTGALNFGTASTDRVAIDSSGRVGIGTSSPISSGKLTVDSGSSDNFVYYQARGANELESSLLFLTKNSSGTSVGGSIGHDGSTNTLYLTGLTTGASTQHVSIDSSGRLLVGTSTARGNINSGAKTLQIETAVNNVSTGLSVVNNSSTGWTSRIALGMTGGTAVGSNTIVSSGNSLGALSWVGADGTNLIEAGRIQTQVDGTPGTNDMPGRLVFYTTADGASSPTERMRIDSSGNVGIGETSPDRKLHVRSDGSYALKVGGESGAAYYLELGQISASSSPGINYTGTNASLRFLNNGSEVARFDGSGNLGIGTTSPDSLLEVEGADTAIGSNGTILVKADSAGADDGGQITLGSANGRHVAVAGRSEGSSGTAGYLQLGVRGSSGDIVERLRIDSSGRVGIGTSSPSAPLHVSGNMYAGASIVATSDTTGLNWYNNLGLLRIQQDTSNTGYCFDVYKGGTNAVKIGFKSDGSAYFASNVGIGTTSPSNKLVVSNGGAAGLEVFFADSGASVALMGYNRSTSARTPLYLTGEDIRFQAGGSDKARIDSSGRLLVGATSSTTVLSTTPALQVVGSTSNQANISILRTAAEPSYLHFSSGSSGNNLVDDKIIARVNFAGYHTSGYTAAARIECAVDGTPGSNDMPGRLTFSTTADGASSVTERMRITSQGALMASTNASFYGLVGAAQFHSFDQDDTQWITGFRNTHASSPYGIAINYTNAAPGGTSNQFVYALDNVGLKFSVKGNGGIENYQANDSNLCDEREKKNIETLDSTWGCLKNWELKKFHYNEDADTDDKKYGVIAQQIAPHCPEVITDWVKQKAEDAVLDDDGNVVTPAKEEIVRMGVKEQQMMWMAIKALQEAQTRIETLEAEVAALKAG